MKTQKNAKTPSMTEKVSAPRKVKKGDSRSKSYGGRSVQKPKSSGGY